MSNQYEVLGKAPKADDLKKLSKSNIWGILGLFGGWYRHQHKKKYMAHIICLMDLKFSEPKLRCAYFSGFNDFSNIAKKFILWPKLRPQWPLAWKTAAKKIVIVGPVGCQLVPKRNNENVCEIWVFGLQGFAGPPRVQEKTQIWRPGGPMGTRWDPCGSKILKLFQWRA